jgi:hypothetical protein
MEVFLLLSLDIMSFTLPENAIKFTMLGLAWSNPVE